MIFYENKYKFMINYFFGVLVIGHQFLEEYWPQAQVDKELILSLEGYNTN